MSTEHNGSNQGLAPTLCQKGCGFYGNSAYDGMCSKCYKDSLSREQSPVQAHSAFRTHTPIGGAAAESDEKRDEEKPYDNSAALEGAASLSRPARPQDNEKTINTVAASTADEILRAVMDSLPESQSTDPGMDVAPLLRSLSIAGAAPTVPARTAEKDEETATDTIDGATASPIEQEKEESEKKKPKKNRCHVCKKKVGLTGFGCRCGGLYCSMHRYSDKHDCQFDYKELAQEQIRKHNPVIVAAKVNKI